jgi:peptidoglycan/LPS O-acetylase OafA/YrhL
MAAFRLDIQALRAIAVLLVLASHVWPAHVHGGYIGVDVFFVVSGYLITGHLVREVASTGRVDLLHFYARRARRLLPAASLTLVAVGLASYLWMPSWTWAMTAADIAASTGYAENWMLVRRAVDYQAQNEAPSPLQHFWSLAVEEQFYFGWPLLVAGVAWLWTRREGGAEVGAMRPARCGLACEAASFVALPAVAMQPGSSLHALTASSQPPPSPPRPAWYAVPMATLCTASFGTALFYARVRPEAGYFTTHTRLYELGMGGLLAVLGGARPRTFAAAPAGTCGTATLQTWLRTLVAAAGLAAIGASAALMTARTHFPGAAALVPTLGASALLWAGEQDADDDAPAHALVAPMSHPWFQFIGDISYSLYLAHWPVVVIYPFATGRVVKGVLADGFLVCVISLGLAHACKRLWEDRFRGTGGGGIGGNAGGRGTKPKQRLPGRSAAPAAADADDAAGPAVHDSSTSTAVHSSLAVADSGLHEPPSSKPPSSPTSGFAALASPRRWRLSPGAGALVMTLLMVAVTLTVAFALHMVAPAVAQDGDTLAATELQDDALDGATTSANAKSASAAASRSRPPPLPPSPECEDFFGPNATRPYPGADAVLHRCATVNNLPVEELVSLATESHVRGLVWGKYYYPDVLAPVPAASPPSPPRHHVVIMGDSHGKRWHPAFDIVGHRLGINVTNLYKSGCAPTLTLVKFRTQPNVECQKYNAASIDKVLHMRPSAVVMVSHKTPNPADKHANSTDVAAGIVQVAKNFVSSGIPVLYIKSTPIMATGIKDCLAREAKRDPAGADLSACSVPREVGVSDGVMEKAADMFPMMRRLPFDDIFCPDDTCHPAIGNVVVYDDAHHLTRAFSLSMANALQQRLLDKAPHLGRR